jgi:UV DNA damage endonuclease
MEPRPATCPKPQLGLVCITAGEAVRYRAMTRKRFLELPAEGRAGALRRLYAENIARAGGAVDFCAARGIKLYRLTSGLFPFADEPLGEEVLGEFAGDLKQLGARAEATGLRVVLHPDQYVVLSSDSAEVLANSLKIMRMHALVFDLLGLPRSPWAAMTLHGGKGDRGARLIEVIGELPDNIRSRLTLENDEKTYGAAQILDICRAARVPMVFDAHHHVCKEKLTSYDDPSVGEMVAAARATWPVPEWQMVHISNGKESFNDLRHSDLVTAMPASYRDVEWIEVEAKSKEEAIEKLRAEWLT